MLGMPDEIIPMIRTLVESQPLLKSLQLDLGLAPHGDPSDSPYSWIIRALMGLQSLETLKLHISLPLYLSESEVREMGASWPRMRILEFWTTSYWMEIPRRGAAPQSDLSLVPCFLREIPRLEELHVSFRCNRPLQAPEEQPPASVLRTLNFGRCPLPGASREEVVAYLAAVLPRDTNVQNQNLYGPSFDFWDKVACDLNSMWKAAQ
ncbi:hypothetical protein FS837_002531 [Tulasnella sp. UAMH 9824]|nr:hypothetical protein FS837_002531 [Tulasnella sp. UAMH 9824]